jgi:putative flippase GtrA
MVRRLLRLTVEGPLAVRLRRFFIVGIVAAGVQQALLFGFLALTELNYLIAAAIAIEITIVLQYGLNNVWTFSADRKTERWAYVHGLAKTNVVRGSAIPLQLGLLYVFRLFFELEFMQAALMDMYLLVTDLSGVPISNQVVLVANLFAIPLSGVYRYVLDARWTWA